MQTLVSVIAVTAGLCWVSALVHWVLLFGHRKPHVSAAKLLFSGTASFSRDNFEEAGWRFQRRFLYSFGGFFVCVLAAMVSAALFVR